MCGICGTAGIVDWQQLEAMNNAIIHRGPDDGGIKILSNRQNIPWIGLASRRLSIIDLSTAGHMPMPNEDESMWIAYNGETFNFLELRPKLVARGHQFRSQSDTEVLLHLYEELGVSFLNSLNGMFAMALWDLPKQQLLLARDPFGIKPLYYLPLPGGKLAFASEIKSFIAGGLLRPEVDPESLHYFINFLWVPGPKTLFKNVYKLPPGHYLLWKEGKYEIHQYWAGEPTLPTHQRSENELIEELRSLLHTSVQRHLISDVPLGVFLSGGLDSSALLALSTKIANRSMTAYTIGFRTEDAKNEQSDEDRKYARLVAKQFGADHHEIELNPDVVDLLPRIVWHLDEPVADPAAITSYLICKAARDKLTVLLSGQGGDEVFGGYRVHLAERFSRPWSWLPNGMRERFLLPTWDMLPNVRNKIPGVQPGKVLAFHRYFRKVLVGAGYESAKRYVFHRSYYAPGEQIGLYSPAFQAQVNQYDPYQTHLNYFQPVKDASFIDQMLYVDQKTFLPELNLTYSDKTSMMASVEVRVPLLDQEIAAFMRQVPAHYKIRGIKQKYLFKRAMEGILPQEVIWRGKAGFGAPIRTWLQRDLTEMIDDLLSPATLRMRGYFEPKSIQQMIHEHRAGTHEHTYRIWALLTLEIWHRTFIDQRVPV